MKSPLINSFNKIKHKFMYPNCTIDWGCKITCDCVLGGELEIGKFSILNHSEIDSKVKIGNNCTIHNSILGPGNIVNSDINIKNTSTGQNVMFLPGSKISDAVIGSFSYIGHDAQISLTNIGKFCSIGPYLIAGIGNHPTHFVSTSPMFYSNVPLNGITFAEKSFYEERSQITIGNDVWIGARVFIKDGVIIGNGACIGAGAIVTKDVPDYAIVGGVPAKIIRFRFKNSIIQRLLDCKWWDWDIEKLHNLKDLMVQEDIGLFINGIAKG